MRSEFLRGIAGLGPAILLLLFAGCAGSRSAAPPVRSSSRAAGPAYRPELIIKLADDLAIGEDNGAVIGSSVDPVLTVLHAYDPNLRLEAVYPRVLDKAQGWELQADPDSVAAVRPGHSHRIMRYAKIQVANRADARRLVQSLAGLREVERVFPRPRIVPHSSSLCLNSLDDVPDKRSEQGYLLSGAEFGFGTEQAWEIAEGTDGRISAAGDAVAVMVIDGFLFTPHPDLPSDLEVLVPFSDPDDTSSHGTMVTGVLAAQPQDPEHGYVGMVPSAKFYFGSYEYLGEVDAESEAVSLPGLSGMYSIDASLDMAYEVLGPGDVLVVSLGDASYQQCDDPTQPLQVPVNASPAYREIILGLGAKGVAVVLSAGNEALDLGATTYPPECLSTDESLDSSGPEHPWLEAPGSAAIRDTLSIIVGAAVPTGTDARKRLGSSNYGARVDCQGWGEDVATLSFDHCEATPGCPDPGCWTTAFSQTSAAAPLVAGVVAALQGAYRAQGLAPLTPLELRDKLRDPDNGYPQPEADFLSTPIGPRPELWKLLEGAGMISEIYVRDALSEDVDPEGGEYHPYHRPRAFQSPDLVLLPIDLAAVGAATTEENYRNEEPDFVERSFEAEAAIVRAKNLGATKASSVVQVYRAPASPLAPPASWEPIGSAQFVDLSAGGIGVEIANPNLPSSPQSRPYYSWVLVNLPAGSTVDKAQIENLGTGFLDFLENHSNIRYRNRERVRVRSAVGAELRPSEPFRVRIHDLAPYGVDQILRIRHRLPPGSILALKTRGLSVRIDPHAQSVQVVDLDPMELRFGGITEFVGSGALQIRDLRLREPDRWFDLEFQVLLPANAARRPNPIHVEQLRPEGSSGELTLLGRMTYVVGPKPLGPP